jgi:predicted metal-dependent TIM-barrel fold hydrolase
MVVTHAMNAPILMTVDQMSEAAKLGAFIEFAGSTLTPPDAKSRIDRYADAIRKVGPQYCILSSDLGQQGNPLPSDGYGEFLAAMRARNFSEQEVAMMSRNNPATLLGLR